MSIKTSDATEKNQKIKRVQNEIKNLLQHKILAEVPEIKKTIENLLLSVSAIEFKNDNPKMIEGEMKTSEEILEMIKDSSGYTKWKLSSTETLKNDEIQEIKQNFNVDFKEKEIQVYGYSRSTNDRNALSYIIVTVLPGFYYVQLHTDKVGYSLEGLVNNKQFKQGIAAESE